MRLVNRLWSQLPPDLVAMDSDTPGTSFYPCSTRAADVFKPQSTLPPIYYLKNHTCVVHNDSEPSTSENDEEEANKEGENTSNHVQPWNCEHGGSVRPPGLPSVRMRECNEKQKSSGGKSDNGDTSKERCFASPAQVCSYPQGPPSET